MSPIQSLIPLLTVALLAAGCKSSFDDAVRGVIDNTPDDSTGRLYVTGTKPYSAADQGDLNLNVWRVDSDPFPDSVQIYARVMKSDGTFISNLAPPYFSGGEEYREIWNGLSEQIGDNGPEYPIQDYTVREFSDKDGIPFEIGLALDYSGSMGSNITFLENAAVTFVKLKLPQDRIAIVKFDDNARLTVPLSGDTADILRRFGRTGLAGFGGYTALYDAGEMAVGQISGTPENHPKGLILFSDGEDNASRMTSEGLYDLSSRHSIPVFAVAFGPANADVLRSLATRTGGKFYQTNDPKELEAIFRDIYLSLRNYYLITYRPPRIDGKHIVSIAITPPGGETSIGATAVYSTYGTVVAIEDPIDTDVQTFDNEVFFAYNSAELQPEATPVIDYYFDRMTKSPTMRLEVQGHTDSVGTQSYNDSLSTRRAAAVKAALEGRGIASDRIRARGFGETSPIATNATEEGRRRNRRTVFKVLRY